MALLARLSAAARAHLAVVAFDHSRVLLPNFSFAQRPGTLARLHRLSLDRGNPRPAPPRGPQLWARLLFASVGLRQILAYFFRHSGYVWRHERIPRRRQLADLWHCLWHHNQYARHYYWRKLYRVRNRADWLENLEHRQVTTLLHHLNSRIPIGFVTHKQEFHRHCLAHQLPSPPLLAAWDRAGSLTHPPAPAAAGDVFVKPADEYGSTGTLALPFDARNGRHAFKGWQLAWEDLLVALAAEARATGRALVLQPRLRNAERHAVFGQHDLCNLRIVTALDADREPEPLGSFQRLPSRFTTTGHDRHILFANVDLASGRLGCGRFREVTRGEFARHPDTGAPIEGRAIPGWPEMLDLALRAHRTLPWLPFVGWDIVDTDRGILLLEANAYWGADAMQAPGTVPLGQTRFPELYAMWFDYFYHRDRQPAVI